MTEPDAVYVDRRPARHYVACFGEDEPTWYRWPAVEHGWLARKGCSATLADACDELPSELARLALRLSDVEQP